MKRIIVALGMSVAMACAVFATSKPADGDPLLKPIAPEYARRWLAPTPPVRVFGNGYLVGFGGLNVGLIKTSAGLILIDGAVPQAVRSIQANIRKLGLDPRDIKLILSTEPHYDHAGGIAALARDSGATVLASDFAAKELGRGSADPSDPQASVLARFPAVARVQAVSDGEEIRLGDTVVKAIATPGHTLGSMSWSWRSCEGKRCATMVFAASTNPTAPDDYRFSDPANHAVTEAFRETFRRLRAMPCDVLMTAHPQQSDGEAKLAKLLKARTPNPFLDPSACKAYADSHEALLEARMEREKVGDSSGL